MTTVNLYNHSPYRPKQSDTMIMLLALGVGMLLCLGGAVGTSILTYLQNSEKEWIIISCPSFPLTDENNDLANTIHASYDLTRFEIDYVPIEEIPLGINYEGPKVKFHNQSPEYITQVGIPGGDVIIRSKAVVEPFPELTLIEDAIGSVDVEAPEIKEVFFPTTECKNAIYLTAPASPTEGEDAFRTDVLSKLNLDYHLNSGEQYLFNINFTIGIDGTLSNIVIQSEQGYLPPHVKKDIIEVFKTMPKWQPASQNNKLVPTTFKLPIKVNVQ